MTKFFLLFFSLFATLTIAQIKGKVTDKNGLPVPFANIYIKDTFISTTSNEQGNFELSLKTKGNYTL